MRRAVRPGSFAVDTKHLLALLSSGLLVVACSSSSSDAAAPVNGVDDVLKACQIRVTWTHATTGSCTDCVSIATAPRCPCSDEDIAGKCADQRSATLTEPTCNGVKACIDACAAADCGCVDGCYAGKEACRTKASAVEGCVVEVCANRCR